MALASLQIAKDLFQHILQHRSAQDVLGADGQGQRIARDRRAHELGLVGSDQLAVEQMGDVVIGTDVVQHDVDTTAMGDEPGFVSTVDRLSFPLDNFASTAIAAAAEELGIRAVRGRIASGDQFVASTARKEEIVRLFSAVTCEMEAGAIAHVCFLNRIPCAVIRSISDGGNEEAPMSYEEFLPLAAKNSAELTLAYLKSLENL